MRLRVLPAMTAAPSRRSPSDWLKTIWAVDRDDSIDEDLDHALNTLYDWADSARVIVRFGRR